MLGIASVLQGKQFAKQINFLDCYLTKSSWEWMSGYLGSLE